MSLIAQTTGVQSSVQGKGSYSRGKGLAHAWCIEHTGYESDECLLWPFAKMPSGCGQFGHLGKSYGAGPFICERRHGPRPTPKHLAGLTCGNRANCCVNPRHLKWMTTAEARELTKARGVYRDANARRKFLTLEQATQIRAIGDTKTAVETAKEFGIQWRHVYSIRANKYWVDGKPGHKGFLPGDPRNTGSRNRVRRVTKPIVVLGSPAARVDPQYAFLEPLVHPAHPGRGDIISAMIIALIEKRVTREELIRTNGRAFKAAFYRENFDLGGYGISLDVPMWNGGSWHDIVPDRPEYRLAR